jgi:hypothetical protein
MAVERVMKTIAILIAMTLVASMAAAQTTRADTIAEQQAEKAKALGAEGPTKAELVIRRVLLSPLLNGGEGLYPWFGSVYSGTGVGIGAGFLKRLEQGAYVTMQTGVSLNNSMVLRGQFAAPELWRGMLQVDANGQWLDARGVSFYGLGQDSDRSYRERFDFAPKDIGGNITIKPRRHVFMSGGYTFMNFDSTRDTPRFRGADAPGLDEELNFHVSRATLAYDWRPAPAYSTRGGLYRASFERNSETKGLPYSFDLQEYEIVQQVPLVREQFVFAVRGLMTLTRPFDGDEVPVMLAPYLGSTQTLRGYPNRRFTDRNRVLLTGEYRWRPSRYLDMALFIDAGQVARDRHDFDVDKFATAWGIGARFHGPTFNALRVEIARGREGIRLIFAGSQPF